MKRSLTICLTLLLAGSSVALADVGSTGDYDQDGTDRPRRIRLQNSGFLGVDLAEVTRESVGRLRLRDERGALVTNVIGDSSAAKAGLQKDDVIVKWNGEAIESAGELWRHIRQTPAGTAVRLGVFRNGGETETTVTLGDRSEYLSRMRADRESERGRYRVRPARERVQRERPARELRERMSPGYRMGISLQSMSPQLAEYFGVSNHNGALVVYVHPDSPAAKAGIKAGDVILSVAGQAVEYPLSVHQILRGKSEGPTEVRVMRDKQERTFTVQVEAEKTSSWVYSPGEFDGFAVQVPSVVLPPMALPRITMPRVVVPSIAPLPSFKYRYVAPNVAPMILPKITIPRITIPKLVIPPIKLVMPSGLFVNPV
jgi:membrane-associated protease RseP (regulator of RpoE activity)